MSLRRAIMNAKSRELVQLTKGYGLSSTSGSVFESATQAVSDYMPVSFDNNTTYSLTGMNNVLQCCIYGYNANKQFIHRSTGAYREYVNGFGQGFFTLGTSQGTGDIKFIRVLQYVVTGTSASIDLVDDIRIILSED